MAELKLKIELPGTPSPDLEIWPEECTVSQMLPRLFADAAERDKGFTREGKDWGLFLKRTNSPLDRDRRLVDSGVRSGDVLILKDELESRKHREQYLLHAKSLVEQGYIRTEDQTEQKRLAAAAELDANRQRELLGALPAEWQERLLSGKPFMAESLCEYQTALSGVPKDGGVPDDLIRAVGKLRKKNEIAPDVHRRLCKHLGLSERLTEKLLEELPPKEDGLAAYRKELEFLKSQQPSNADELKQLMRLQKQHRVSPSDHATMALEAGFTSAQSELLWQGIPPQMLEKEAALDAYKSALRAAWFDQQVTPSEHNNLAQLRTRHKITSVAHMKVCKDLKIPQETAEALLRPLKPKSSSYRFVIFAFLILAAGVGVTVWTLGGKWRPFPALHPGPGTASPARPPTRPPATDGLDSTVTLPPDKPSEVPPRRPDAEVAIETEPSGAAVYVDGKYRDRTPCHVKATPGEHRITLRMRGYRNIDEMVGFSRETLVILERRLEPK